jgi:hypothetical protein
MITLITICRCGISILASAAVYLHPFTWCSRVSVVGLATSRQPNPGLEIDQSEPGRWVEPAA